MNHVLFVDDDPLITMAYESALSAHGFKVDVAHDGIAALSAMRKTKPDVLILDLVMPRLSGGDVLKLIGDGTLAIFTGEDREKACRAALAAAARLRKEVGKLTGTRSQAGLPTTQVYLALHVGDVFYGNVGSKDRLDFTVIGPAVNEVSRILAMSRSVEQDVLLSSAFAASLSPEVRDRLVSVGRYALRGVTQPQELFTLEPGFAIPASL